MSNELCYITARDAIQKFKNRDLSPVELLEAIVRQAEHVEPIVNAFTYTYYEKALDEAKRAEENYRKGRARPLEGIPLAVKDEVDHKGYENSNGSLLLKDNIAEVTTPMLQRLLDAGAIVHARTAVPEFCLHACTWSRLWGVTRNPWNPDYSPGGSSGGSGASLAAGTTTLATGSDIGGSIRIPASQTGVIGYKPPYGRVPQFPLWNFDTYCHDGPMARSVADTILFQNVVSGPHPEDIVSIHPSLQLPERFEGISGMRVAYCIDFGGRELDVEVRQNTMHALETLKELGAVVEEVELPWGEDNSKAAMNHLLFLAGNYFKRGLAALERSAGRGSSREQLTPYIKHFLERVDHVSIDDYLDSKEIEGQMYRQFSTMMRDHDVLVCPTVATASVPAAWDYSCEPLLINGKEMQAGLLGGVMTYYFNTLSRCPVINVPSGLDRNGVPTGIQIVGHPYRDECVFRVATAYEANYNLRREYPYLQ